MPGKHSAKQKRQAKHIADSERARGMDPKRAESVGWATVNAHKSVKRKKGARLAKDVYMAPPPASTPSPTVSSAGPAAPPPSAPPAMSTMGPRGRSLGKALHPHAAWAAKELNAGRQVKHENGTRAYRSTKLDDKTGKTEVSHFTVVSPHGMKTTHSTAESAGAAAHAHVTNPKFKKAAMKSFRLMTIDEAYAVMKGEGGPPAPVSPGAMPAPKKFPRKDKPTVKMKPVSDAEAMANLKAGKYIEKTLRRALQTGYGKTSGGGALKAPNRGARTMRDRPSSLSLSINDLNRAVGASPPPVPGSSARPYLPGVHPTSAKPKFGDAGRKMGMPPKKSKSMRADKSERPTAVSSKSPRVLDGGGATELSNSIKNVVHKSGGAPPMEKTNFNDLFKAELGTANDEVLCECPHCEAPITKSDLSKASGHKGKGSATHISGSKTAGHGSAHVRDQNPEGGTMRGGDGKGVITPSRGVPGAKKTDDAVGVQNSKGSKGSTRKAMPDNDSSSDDASSDDDSDDKPFEKKKEVKKSIGQPITIRGTEWVQYVDDGSDAALAKSISEGLLGGTPPTQPLDLNNDLTRLLI